VPTSWKWDLGNGTISQQQNPSSLYFTPGVYTIKLVVQNASGSDSITKTSYITIYNKPTVAFSATPLSGCPPVPVHFSDQSSPGSGAVTQWTWDFGDGQISHDQNPTNTYTVGNSFGVTLTVKNNFGCSQSLQKTNYINISSGVTADFGYAATSNCQAPITMQFTNASTSTNVLTYQWIFGDGSSSTQASPSHVYTQGGKYSVTLIATSANGCSDMMRKDVVVGGVAADFTTGNTCTNQQVNFTNTSNPAATSANWLFGDGSTSSDISPTHTYTTAGSYQVTLQVTAGGCTASQVKTVTVTDKPHASFTVSGSFAQCALPAGVSFNNTSSGAPSAIWGFGDSTGSTSFNATHVYNQPGTYNITLIAIAGGGCTDTLVQVGKVQVGPPKILSFSNLPFSGCVNTVIGFHANIQSGEAIASYKWDFGDGATSADSVPTHSYAAAGAYGVKLVVTTTGGCQDSLTLNPAIVMADRPTANFTQLPTDICASSNIQFTDGSAGTITKYIWDFRDGDSSLEQNPLHHFRDTGTFFVRLTVFNGSCFNTFQTPAQIHVQPPIARYSFFFACFFNLDRIFLDRSIVDPTLGNLSWNWDFGDGTTSTQQNPGVHSFPAPGNYTVKETVTNGACTDVTAGTIQVIGQAPVFTYSPSPTDFCRTHGSVRFNATHFDPSIVTNFSWDFGDGGRFGGPDSVILHTYSVAGIYTVIMTATDIQGCHTQYSQTITVKLYGPYVGFTIQQGGQCKGATVNFTDATTTDGIHPITTYIWSYGDGVTDTVAAPATTFQHVYNTGDSFSVKLIVVDSYGCSDSLTRTQAVLIGDPRAKFAMSDSIRCTNNNVGFSNLSTGNIVTYAWNFGDGATSSLASPSHKYIVQDTFRVKLKVTDKLGCQDSTVASTLLQIANPKASFILTDTFASCPPLLIQPQNTSTYARSVSWNFGDGNISNIVNPSHFYTQGGNNRVVLVAQGFGQCSDSAIVHVVLNGPTGHLTYIAQAGCSPVNASITATTQPKTQLTWDFGDGIISSTTIPSVSHVYSIAGLYVPKLLVEDSNGCVITVPGVDTFHVAQLATAISVHQQLNCDSAQVFLADSSQVLFDRITQYSFRFGDGTVSQASSSTHTYKQSGTYRVSLAERTVLGCVDSVNIPLQVIVYRSPRLIISVKDTGCTNQALSFAATDTLSGASSVTSWQWDFGTGVSGVGQQVLYSYLAVGNYLAKVAAVNTDGCIGVASHPVDILLTPTVDAGPDTTLCLGRSVVFHATGAVGYTWTANPSLSCTSCSSPTVTPVADGYYYVTGDVSGCRSADSLHVHVIPPFITQVNSADTICIGTSVQLHASGALVYRWQPANSLNDPASANPIASPTQTTQYTLITTGERSCFSDTSGVPVVVYPIPVFTISDSVITANVGFPVTIATKSSPDITHWEWTPPNGLSCSNCPEPIAQPRNDIVYIANVSNDGHCTSSAQVTVRVLCNGTNIFIPNTFSPNGDGMNDRFYPRGRGLFTITSFRIFNRYGQLIFEKMNVNANAESDGWDGTFLGQRSPSDVYVYVMEVRCENNETFTIKGNVTLLR